MRHAASPTGWVFRHGDGARPFQVMSNEEYAKENRELRRMIQRLKEQLTKALERIEELSKK